MKENKTISKYIKKTIKKRLLQAFFLLFLFFLPYVQEQAQAVNVSSFTYFKTLILAGSDIQLLGSINYDSSISTLTAQSIIRGGADNTFFTLQGRRNHNGLYIGLNGKIEFIGNLIFNSFKAQRDLVFGGSLIGGALYASRSGASIMFNNASISFTYNIADYGASIALTSLAFAS
ncbi:MAG: hypothetical protein LBT79_02805, partial [Elusimicrobiota bacterium]|nr:hypothetical protein [Elusimicrobiota bacterium]